MPQTAQDIQRAANMQPPVRQRDMEAIRAYLERSGATGDFNRGTRQSILTQPVVSFVQGQPQKIDLPQTGFLADVICMLSGQVTTAAASTTTVRNYIPPPVGIVRRARLFNNQGVDIWNTSAWGAILINKTQQTHFDPLVLQAGQFNYAAAFGTSLTPFTRYFNDLPSQVADTTELFRAMWRMPVAWGPALQAGLQLLQDPAIRYSLEIGWGDGTDLFSATAGTVTLSNIQVEPTVILYHVPERAVDLPKLSFTKTTLEDTQPILTGNGENTYKFVTGNMASKVVLEYVNTPAGVQTPLFPTGASEEVGTNPVTRIKLRYSQTQIPYDASADAWLAQQRYNYSQDLPGGVYVHELSMPNGLPALVGVRDILNTARLTDLDLIATLSGVTPANAFIRGIREQLVKNR